MRLLILTQAVDRNDPALGFFHRWLEEFARHFEKITVICLRRGEYKLPNNVVVYSLGKEMAHGPRLLRILRYIAVFLRYIISMRQEYNAVLVHMNEEYALLGGFFWKILRRPLYLWRNHYAGSWRTDIAAYLSAKIFCTSRFSYTAQFKHTVIMPVGIDTDTFAPDILARKIPDSILSLGRIAPSKNLPLLFRALGILFKGDIPFEAHIYGDLPEGKREHIDELKGLVDNLGITKHVHFSPGVSHDKTPELYRTHKLFVNTSPSGMYDKTILEALACGTPAISSNKNLKGEIDDRLLFEERSAEELAERITALLGNVDNAMERSARSYVIERHSIGFLAHRLAQEIC